MINTAFAVSAKLWPCTWPVAEVVSLLQAAMDPFEHSHDEADPFNVRKTLQRCASRVRKSSASSLPVNWILGPDFRDRL